MEKGGNEGGGGRREGLTREEKRGWRRRKRGERVWRHEEFMESALRPSSRSMTGCPSRELFYKRDRPSDIIQLLTHWLPGNRMRRNLYVIKVLYNSWLYMSSPLSKCHRYLGPSFHVEE